MTDECPLCFDAYTAAKKKKITCQFCPAAACRPCLQTNVLSASAEPACYDCKREWSADFINDNFGVIFRTKTLRVHRRKIVSDRERALLPSMQVFVGYRKRMEKLMQTQAEIQPKYLELSGQFDSLRGKVHMNRDIIASMTIKETKYPLSPEEIITKRQAEENYATCTAEFDAFRSTTYSPFITKYYDVQRRLSNLTYRYKTGAAEGDPDQKKERREFIMRCPGADCRGFLSTAYKCGTCSKKTCSECTEIIDEDSDTEHKCKPESVESTKAIKKETRPCPKCAAPIFKIDGCDQMWCTNGDCNTAFSWTTGHVVTGRVHNPHYYEWIRRTGGGQAPREVGDIPCGGIPGYHQFSQPFITKYHIIPATVRNSIFEIHRRAVEIEEALTQYPQQVPALMNKETNVKYLMNEMTEEAWIVALEHADAKFQKKREIGQILHTLVTATADILRRVAVRMGEPGTDTEVPAWIEGEIMPTLESLRTYTNDTFKKLGKSIRLAMPQISARWALQAPRRIHMNTIIEVP